MLQLGDVVIKNDEYYIKKINKAQDKNLWPVYSDQADNKYGILTAKLPEYYGNF